MLRWAGVAPRPLRPIWGCHKSPAVIRRCVAVILCFQEVENDRSSVSVVVRTPRVKRIHRHTPSMFQTLKSSFSARWLCWCEPAAENRWFDGISRRKVCNAYSSSQRFLRTHVVFQNTENSWQARFLAPQRLVASGSLRRCGRCWICSILLPDSSSRRACGLLSDASASAPGSGVRRAEFHRSVPGKAAKNETHSSQQEEQPVPKSSYPPERSRPR